MLASSGIRAPITASDSPSDPPTTSHQRNGTGSGCSISSGATSKRWSSAMPFVEPTEMIEGSPLPGWSGRFFHSANMTFAHWDIAEGAADLHEHHHEQEEVWHIVEGEVVLRVGGEERRLGPGA